MSQIRTTITTPISTYLTRANLVPGYYNLTNADIYSDYETTEYSTYISTIENTEEQLSYSYITKYHEQLVTSTLIVFNSDVTESLSLTTGYQTITSTYFPDTYVTVISQTPAAPALKTYYPTTTTATHTYTVTVSAIPDVVIPTSTTSDVCGFVAAKTVELFSGLAYKNVAPSAIIYLISFIHIFF